MTPLLLLAALLFLGAAAYQAGRRRALAAVNGDLRRLHSLPTYYGVYVALWCALPALLVLAAWVALQGRIVEAVLVSELPQEARALPPERLTLLVNEVRNAASGAVAGTNPLVQAAARRYLEHQRTATAALAVVTLALAVAAGSVAWRRVRPRMAAITAVERIVKALLLAGSCVAVLTTIGIVLSLLFEALRFFQRVPVSEFLCGLHWSPQTGLRARQVGGAGAV